MDCAKVPERSDCPKPSAQNRGSDEPVFGARGVWSRSVILGSFAALSETARGHGATQLALRIVNVNNKQEDAIYVSTIFCAIPGTT